MNTVGRLKLQRFIIRRGWSQAKFAQRADLNLTFINLVINGKKRPGEVARAKIEAATRGKVPALSWFKEDKYRAPRRRT